MRTAQDLLNQAIALHRSGRLTEAAPLYLGVQAAAPESFQAQYLFGVLRYQQQRGSEALTAVEAALQKKPQSVEALMLRGVLLQGAGRLEEALGSLDQALKLKPEAAEGWYNYGVILCALGRETDALAAFDRALKGTTSNIETWLGRGTALLRLGRPDEALQSFNRALALDSRNAMAQYNRAIALDAMAQCSDALEAFDKALELAPRWTEAWNNRGATLFELGRIVSALESYDKALEIQPDYAPGWKNRGDVMQKLNRFDEAVASYDRALSVLPDDVVAWKSRGDALKAVRRFAEAVASFDTALQIVPADARAWAGRADALRQMKRTEDAVSSYEKALHLAPDDPDTLCGCGAALRDLLRYDEALAYADKALSLVHEFPLGLQLRGEILCAMNRIAEGVGDYRRSAEVSYQAVPTEAAADPEHKKRHDSEQRDWLAEQGISLPEGIYFADGEKLSSAAVNPVNAEDVAVQWRRNRPQVVVIDDLLTPAALEKLRRFCWGSTIWRKSYGDGYLGAMPDSGFACPLLAQIAEELRVTFPAIFAHHSLTMFWGFKYDSSLGGIRIHADQAAVNVNFWITPDEANQNPETGGLVIWDTAAPQDWEFNTYNGDDATVRDFLARASAKPITIPYRANRAVIFDSDLFHETDTRDFKDGYLNRRINITMLYGRRTPDGR